MADSRLVRIISALYRHHTPDEIADAHRIVRQRLDLVVTIQKKKQSIADLQTELEELQNVND
jgi:hypothetical protein